VTEVVLTGAGLTTRLGDGAEAFWRRLRDGDCTLAPQPTEPLVLDRTELAALRARMLTRVAREALAQARLDGADGGGRWLVVVAAQADDGATPALDPPALREAPRIVVSHACASAGFGLALGRAWLHSGRADRVLLLSACVQTDHELKGMAVARTLSPAHARPFDPQRDGTVVGEGAGALVLERGADAARRGAAPLAALAGIACRVGGGSRAGIDERVARRCVEAALADAGKLRIGYVHAHATGTVAGDDAELALLAALPGAGALPVSSHKGCVGHLMHCSMVSGVVAAIGALRERTLPGTLGLSAPRTHGRVRLLRDAEPCPGLEGALVNGFGFGDNNAALVLARAADERT